MSQLKINNSMDTLVFLGDYIDRGPQSMDVVDYLLHLSQKGHKTVFLKGNHEAMLLDYLSGKNKLTFLMNGGSATLNNYMQNMNRSSRAVIPPSHIDFLQSLRLYYETDAYIFVHAGLAPGIPLNQQQEMDLLWIRDRFINATYDFGKIVLFGHTPFKEPLIKKNKIGIDTGAVYGNKLTCVELPSKKFYSA